MTASRGPLTPSGVHFQKGGPRKAGFEREKGDRWEVEAAEAVWSHRVPLSGNPAGRERRDRAGLGWEDRMGTKFAGTGPPAALPWPARSGGGSGAAPARVGATSARRAPEARPGSLKVRAAWQGLGVAGPGPEPGAACRGAPLPSHRSCRLLGIGFVLGPGPCCSDPGLTPLPPSGNGCRVDSARWARGPRGRAPLGAATGAVHQLPRAPRGAATKAEAPQPRDNTQTACSAWRGAENLTFR